MRRAVGRASPVAVAISLSDMVARPARKAVTTSSPRARDSMKSGPLPGRGMATPSHDEPVVDTSTRPRESGESHEDDRRTDGRPVSQEAMPGWPRIRQSRSDGRWCCAAARCW